MNARMAFSGLAMALALAWATPAAAHCDTLDGPVVSAARAALEASDARLVLGWVAERDEPQVRAAFERAIAVRGTGTDARELADGYFFETVVRLHRAGEGAPYTGLKAAGEIEAPVAAADAALAAGAPDDVAKLLSQRLHAGLHERFEAVAARREREPADVEAGRAYVRAYVDYVHYVEHVYTTAGAGMPHMPAAAHEH